MRPSVEFLRNASICLRIGLTGRASAGHALRDRLVIVVLDTNVFVSPMVAKGLCHEVVVRGLGCCTVATSQFLLEEFEDTLRAKFTLCPAGIAFLEQLRLRVRIVEPTPLRSPVSRDTDDDRVLATAVAAGAAVIVSGIRTFWSSVATTASTASLPASS